MHLRIAADDRTGALEVAAALADRSGFAVPVSVWPNLVEAADGASVVDLGSRHLQPGEAARRAAELPGEQAAHKIDSTLRGNWAAELSARHRRHETPVLLVPALPGLGRTCVNGVVLLDGRPVHETAAGDDARRPVTSSRPVDHLATYGVATTELATLADVERWLGNPHGVGVADAVDDATLDAIVEAWRIAPDVLLAGTSAVIGRAVDDRHLAPIGIAGPALVAIGSLNPAARRQVEVAVEVGLLRRASTALEAATSLAGGHHTVLATTVAAGGVEQAAADAAAQLLADEVHRILASATPGVIVVIGGDTASAVLGDATVSVVGALTLGSAVLDGTAFGVPVVTRAGGFGGDSALLELLWGTLPV